MGRDQPPTARVCPGLPPGLPLHRHLLMRQTRRKPEICYRPRCRTEDKFHLAERQVRIETHHPQHAWKQDAHGQPCSNRCPHPPVLLTEGSSAGGQQAATCGKKQGCSAGDSVHDHTKGKLLPVFTPSHSNWAMVQQQGHRGLFSPPSIQSRAVLCQEKGVRAAPLPPPLRDCLMQSGDVPCSLLIPIAFPPPRWQGHPVRLVPHTKSTGNETLRTPRKPERVPSQRCAAGMLLSELQPSPSRWSTNTLDHSKDY